MPTVYMPAQLTVEHLITAVKQLSPAELREFSEQLAKWQEQKGEQADEETALSQATRARLPAADARRLKRLIAKSERGTLTPKQVEEYRSLAQLAERLNVTRAEALAKLVRRRGKPARVELVGKAEIMARQAVPGVVRRFVRVGCCQKKFKTSPQAMS